MRDTEVNNNTEQQIVRTAKQLFLEKGFSETSMSDIALKAGVNRSVLNYYFRTKENLFETVFADIVKSFILVIQDIVLQDKPIAERISDIVDLYYELVGKEPFLPFFVLREINRDARHLVDVINKIGVGEYMAEIKSSLRSEMDSGKIKKVHLELVFYTFYGLLSFPFLSKPLANILFGGCDMKFDDKLSMWKMHIVSHMERLLKADDRSLRNDNNQQ